MITSVIAFLQTIFETADPGRFHWSPNPEDTEIIITEENPVMVDTLEKRPAIQVGLGQVRWDQSSLDDLQALDLTTGKETHTTLLPGNVTINCLSRVQNEARFLAWICSRTLWNLRKLFLVNSPIHEIGRGMGVGSVTPPGAVAQGDTEAEWVLCPVMVPFFIQWRDSVTSLKKDWSGSEIALLRAITISFQTRMGLADPGSTSAQDSGRILWGTGGPALRSPRINGRTLPTNPSGASIPLDGNIKV